VILHNSDFSFYFWFCALEGIPFVEMLSDGSYLLSPLL